VYARLRDRNLALALLTARREDARHRPGGLHVNCVCDAGYQEPDIDAWADSIRDLSTRCTDVFAYFKHEDEGKGPEFGRMLKERLGS
jgi:uncharacterized protein YecE (DUF72 family)